MKESDLGVIKCEVPQTFLQRRSIPMVLLVTATVGIFLFSVQAAGSQSISDLTAPKTANAGTKFTVSVKVQYDFSGQGDIEVWARVRRDFAGSGDVARAVEDTKTVRGKGDLAWSFQIEAPSGPGDWGLEAYAFHWEASKEIIDDTKKFTVTIVGVAQTTTSATTSKATYTSASSTRDMFSDLGLSLKGSEPILLTILAALIIVLVVVVKRKPRKSTVPKEAFAFCISCGSKIPSDASHCPKCGEKKVST
jgi:ribosomal protein L40E